MGSSIEFTTCECCGSSLMICAQCEKPFPRRPHEDETSWGSRRYCGTDCAAKARSLIANERREALLAEKPCERAGCDKMCRQRRNESPASFQERRFCSFECSCLARRMSPPEKLEKRRERTQRRREKENGVVAPEEAPKPFKRSEPELTEKAQQVLDEAVKAPPAAPERPVWRPAAWVAMEAAGRR